VPDGLVPFGVSAQLVVAVTPGDPRTRVQARLRINGGPERIAPLRLGRRTRDEQFFEGSIPGLRGGETVEYSVCVELARQGRTARLERLVMSENAVKYCFRYILDKLHVQNRAQVIAFGVRHGMVEPQV
jgi:hypothetical protein